MKLGKKPNNYYGSAWDLDENDKRHSLYRKQRKERGFDDTETWALDDTIAAFILPRLKRLKELHNFLWFYPDSEKGITEEMAREETKKVFDKMIAAFQYIKDCNYNMEPEPEYVQEGLQLFALQFRRLWW